MELKGRSGTLLAGGREAAKLRNWTVDHAKNGSVIRATVEPVNPFWLEHCPRFDVVLQVGSRSWRWRQVEVTINQTLMRCRVKDKPEVRDGR